ncbi:hypothetical protein MPSEU_000321900 [Mayamaea pseudoterrestris]|nr:hypothetical protein MPSEU_000321900 [Mayamaea pseudoterrestris]
MAILERIIVLERTVKGLLAGLCLIVCILYMNDVRNEPLKDRSLRLSLPDDASSSTTINNKHDPILVMGLPRSGSLSIHNYFQCNGIKSAHYCCGNSPKSSFSCGSKHPTCGSCVLDNLSNAKPAFEHCGSDYQVYSQFDVEASDPFEWFLPQHFALPLLHKDYPKAVWILNQRDNAGVWADSVLHWYTVSLRLMNSFGMNYHEYPKQETTAAAQNKFPLMGPQTEMTQNDVEVCLTDAYDAAVSLKEHARRRAALESIYERHLQKVRQFVQDHPSHRLIEMNVDDVNAVEALTKEFPKYKPNCWHFNAQDYDGDWKDFTLKV